MNILVVDARKRDGNKPLRWIFGIAFTGRKATLGFRNVPYRMAFSAHREYVLALLLILVNVIKEMPIKKGAAVKAFICKDWSLPKEAEILSVMEEIVYEETKVFISISFITRKEAKGVMRLAELYERAHRAAKGEPELSKDLKQERNLFLRLFYRLRRIRVS